METSSKRYTLGEQIFNAVSHGVGAVFGLIGSSVLVTLAICYAGGAAVAACLVYGISLVLLYTMSTVYHALPDGKAARVMRVFDHCSIFVLIAGSYTPFTLIALGGTTKGIALSIVLWVAAVFGIVVKCFGVDRFKKLSLVLYLAMGWAAVFALKDIVHALPLNGIILLAAGGLAYTVGVLFYIQKNHRYMHAVWHLFVLAGSVLHYFCVVLYVLPLAF